jgi:outer membrane receptor protein involved in Fe transport
MKIVVKKSNFVILLLLIMLSQFNLSAQQILLTNDTVQIEEVIISAARTNRPSYDLPLPVTKVDLKEITDFQYTQPADALKSKAGLWILKTGASNGAPILRGFIGSRVVYVFDGVKINTANGSGSSNTKLNTLDGFSMKNIEVIRGSSSVLYGSDAIGGVISVQTETRPEYTEKLSASGRLISRYATADESYAIRPEIQLSSSKLFVTAGLTKRKANNLRVGGGTVLDPSSWEEFNWNLQANYKLKENHEIGISYSDFSSPEAKLYCSPTKTLEKSRQMTKVSYKTNKLGFLKDLQINGYYQKQSSEFYSVLDEETLGFNLKSTSLLFDKLKLTYVAHYHHDDILGYSSDHTTEDPTGDFDNAAIATNMEWQVAPRLRFDLGLRGDYFKLKSKAADFDKLDENIQNAITTGTFNIEDLSINQSNMAITGSAGLVFEANKNLNLVGNLARGFRAPNYNDMCSTTEFSFGYSMPTEESLKSEESMTYEVGIRPHGKKFSATLTYYYTVLNNYIESVAGSFAGIDSIEVDGTLKAVYISQNASDPVYVNGVEMEWKYNFWNCPNTGLFSTYGNATWMEGKNKATDEPIDRSMPTNALAGLRWDSPKNNKSWSTWAACDMWAVSEFDDVSSNMISDPAYLNDPADSSSGYIGDGDTPVLPSFCVFNIQAGLNLKLNKYNCNLVVSCKNLMDKNYRVNGSRMDAPGRNLITSLNISF